MSRSIARRITLAVAAGAAVLLSAAGATAASAADSAPARQKTVPVPPPGYTVVAASFTATTGAQSHGSVACPRSSVPIGDAVASSSDLAVTMNSTEPMTGGWTGRVDNASAGAVVMAPFAICAGT
jgi:hypothetical protein